MLESFDFGAPQSKRVSLVPKIEYDSSVKYLFIVVSCAYMLPFTCIGSLIIYFSSMYGKNYFIYLNIAFYMSGLPTCLIQRKVDSYVDVFYGSKFTYRRRLGGCLSIMTICLILAPFLDFYTLILDVVIVGCCTWICHGSTTSLSGMVQQNSSIMQQIGFALPAVYGVVANIVFDLSREDISVLNLMLFYFTSAFCCVLGIVAWVYLCRTDIVRAKLVEKDAKLGSLLINSAIRSNAPAPSLRYPLLAPDNRFDETQEGSEDEIARNSLDISLQQSFTHSSSFGLGDDLEGGANEISSESKKNMVSADGSSEVNMHQPHASFSGSVRASLPRGGTLKKHSSSFSGYELRVTEANVEIIDTIDDAAFAILSQDTRRIIEDSRRLLKDSPKLLEYAMRSDHCRSVMEPYRWALFINIFASILQGSFISYATGCILSGVELPTVLYFVRIFADLVGRPLALLPKPYYFAHINGVLVAAVVRGLSTCFFFSVIANVIYPQEYAMSTLCHVIVLIFQVFFSMTSGYFNCLTYDYASKAFCDEWERVLASQYLNLTFHRACTSAVLTAITLILLVDVIKSQFGIHIQTTHV